MSDPLKIAAVGLGWVMLHRHLPAIARHPDLKLIGVIDRHKGLAEKVARQWHAPHYAQQETLQGLDWLHEADAITIAAPPMAHAALCQEALAMGKHVLTEKPFAMSVEEGEAIGTAAQKAGKRLAIVHNFQFARAVKKLEADLAAGKLGAVRRIAAVQLGNPRRRLPKWYEQLPLGLFYDESPHFFYLLHKLAGSLTLRKAHGVRGQKGEETPSLVHLLYTAANGIPVTIDCQFDSAISEWYVMVTGEKAVGIVDIFRDIYIRLPNDGAHNALQILRTSASAFAQHFYQHIPNGLALITGKLDYGNDEIMDRFARSIRTGNGPNKNGFDEALAVLKLQHEAIQEIRANLLS